MKVKNYFYSIPSIEVNLENVDFRRFSSRLSATHEESIKEKAKATIRCIPLNNEQEVGTCILTGKPSTQRVLFARAY